MPERRTPAGDDARNGIDGVLAEAANAFERKLDGLAARNATRQREEISSLTDFEAPALWEANRRLTRDSRRQMASSLANGRELPKSCPEPDVEAVQLAIRGGMTLNELLKAYRIGHACTWDAWLEVLSDLSLGESDSRDCFAIVSRYVIQYDERIADLVGDEYVRQQQSTADVETARFKLFRDLLEGRVENVNGLDYAVDLTHIGVIAWGDDAASSLERLAKTIDCRLCFVRAGGGLLMGWLGCRRQLDDEASALLRAFRPPPGTAIALGEANHGYEGLRRTHRQAGDAHVVAMKRPRRMTFYSDVSLEALALRDESAASEFVADVLGAINGEDARALRLRTTLLAYFRHEQNTSATAAALGVHVDTVRRQLAEIGSRIDSPVNQRRAELEIALRLRELLRGVMPNDSGSAK